MTDQAPEPFKYIGGHPALDFANTVDRWDDGVPSGERLNSYADLVRWSVGAGTTGRAKSRHLAAAAARQPREAARVLARGLELRSLLDELNGALAAILPHQSLVGSGDGFAWSWDDAAALDRPLWPVLRAASELLTSDRLQRVRVCGGERCRWLFLDETKNHSRRWCDMSVCGNRAKARRHYRRGHGHDRPPARKAGRA